MCVLFISCAFFFVGNKVATDHFKDENIPPLKESYRLKFSDDVEINHVRWKEKSRCKISYKLFDKQYGYDPLLYISLFLELIQLTDFLGGIQHCDAVVGE